MSENIMYKNIADKMKKESLETIRDSYDETMPKQEFERSLKYIEDYITNLQTIERQYSAILSENAELQTDIQELNNSITWWNNRYNALQRDYEDYKSRCEKAIEYIEDVMELSKECPQDLLNILNGRSDE